MVRQFDVIVLCRHYIAVKYVDLVRRVAPDAMLLFDTIDLHYLRLRRQAVLDNSAKTRKLAEIAYQEELSVADRADLTLVVSDVEARELAQQMPRARVEVLSNVHDAVDDCPPAQARSGILFVGGFQHPPNTDAVEFYAAEIWPRFRELHPQARSFIAGSRMSDALRRLGEEAGIEMLGYVEDLSYYLRSCRMSISPLRYGAGVKGKVNQAMSYGLPLVATSVSTEGMSLISGQHLLIANSPDDFVQAMSKLTLDDDLWHRLSYHSREYTRAVYSTDVTRRAVAKLLKYRRSRL
jgi:glycosyltransferase involved in cell wall biosynthesis